MKSDELIAQLTIHDVESVEEDKFVKALFAAAGDRISLCLRSLETGMKQVNAGLNERGQRLVRTERMSLEDHATLQGECKSLRWLLGVPNLLKVQIQQVEAVKKGEAGSVDKTLPFPDKGGQ